MMITMVMMASAISVSQAQCIPTTINGFQENLLQATFHTVLYKTPNGYAASGEGTAPNGLDQPNIQEISNANGYTGIPAGTTLMWGSLGSHAQLVFLGDDNVIYAGGIEGLVLNPTLTSSKVYQPIPLAMPAGVTYNDVVKFQAAAEVLMMMTESGQIYLTGNNCGNVATPCNNLSWNLVSLPVGVTPQIVDLTFRTIVMFGSDGNFYTRGTKNFIGNGTTWFSNAATWTQMTLPPLSAGSVPVQLELGNLIDQNEVSYLVLDMDGTIHSMGNAPIVGNNSSASNTWTKVGQNCTGGVLQDVVFITASDNDYRNVGAGAILADGTVRLWGMDDNNMLAGASLVCPTEPCMDVGVTMDDMVYLENGTHLTPAISGAGLLCNVGHNSDGGFGDGTEEDRNCYECNTLPTLPVLCVNGECGIDTLITAAICNGQSYTQGSSVYTDSGTYVDIFESAQGCDSVVTLELTVTNSLSSLNVITICEGESYTEGSSTYTATGTYTDFYAASGPGCDSVVTTELTVVSPISVTNTVVICEGETHTEGSSTYSSTGIYTDQYQTSAGCDSTVTTDLTVGGEINVTNVVEICSGSSYVEGNSTYSSTGIYTDTYTSAAGCDSVVTTDLTVNDPIAITNTVSICSGSSYSEGSSVYTETGVYTDSYLTSSGCDSIVTTDLSVLNEISVTNVVSICEGTSYTEGSSVYSETGIYTDAYTTASGCDSVVTTELTVNSQIEITNIVSICQGDSYNEGPSTYTESGNFTDSYQTASGCDSIVFTELTVHLPDETINEVELCNGESYFEQNSEYTTTGTYLNTYSNSQGCDSVVTTVLTVYPLGNTVNEVELCEGEVYQEGSSEYSESGTYTDTYQTAFGCDSIVTTNLIVHQPDEVTNEVSICEGEVYFEQNSAYSDAGTYTNSYQNMYGCDSTVTTVLTVDLLPVVLLNTEPVEGCETFEVTFENQATNSGQLSYLWAAGNGQTSTEVTPAFTFSGTGAYYVSLSLISASGCVSAAAGSQVVFVHPGPQASFTASEWQSQVNSTIEFQSTSSADVVSSEWVFGDGASGTGTSISHLYENIGTYNVTLTVTSEWGCEDEVTQPVLIHPDYTILIPNAFTPNPHGPGDGTYDITSSINQVFFPYAEHVDEFEMFIFDRWGEQLFWTRDINIGWDGYFKGRMCQQDVYSYRVKVNFVDGKRIQKLGTVTLFR
jgi:gliding motility-associated-like protein